MARVARICKDPIADLYDWASRLETRISQLKGNSITVDVTNADALADGAGQVWIDASDHTLHYVSADGSEYKLTGTLV
jgi:hypothetical protein